LGRGGRRFESCPPDKVKSGVFVESLLSKENVGVCLLK
jgi:hypothetical protein